LSRSGAPRSAAPPQRVSFLLEIYSVHARMGALVQREFDRDGVPLDDYATLSAIGAFGPIRLKELASMLGTAARTMSDVVRRLERRRHVRRRANPDDGRSTLLELTAAGDRLCRSGWPALRRATPAMEESLDVPADEIREALRRLDAALAEASIEI